MEEAIPYVGQPKRHESDEFSVWHDYSNPDLHDRTDTPEDKLNPDRPQGATTTPPPKVRWFRKPK